VRSALPLLLASSVLVACGSVSSIPRERARSVVIASLPERADAFDDVTEEVWLPKPITSPSLEAGEPCPKAGTFDFDEENDYRGTLWAFVCYFERTGSPKALYNLGVVQLWRKRLPFAHAALSAYRDRAPELSNERRAEVAKMLGELEEKMGWIAIRCDTGIEDVEIDDAKEACRDCDRERVDLTRPGPCPFRRRIRVSSSAWTVRGRATEGAATLRIDVAPRATVGLRIQRE
jgi:hypothetical protein